jgi:hypothetical protein
VLAFFDALGEERCNQIELVSADMGRVDLRADRRSGPLAPSGAWTRFMS